MKSRCPCSHAEVARHQPPRRGSSPSEGRIPSLATGEAYRPDGRRTEGVDPATQSGQRDHDGRDCPGRRPHHRGVPGAPLKPPPPRERRRNLTCRRDKSRDFWSAAGGGGRFANRGRVTFAPGAPGSSANPWPASRGRSGWPAVSCHQTPGPGEGTAPLPRRVAGGLVKRDPGTRPTGRPSVGPGLAGRGPRPPEGAERTQGLLAKVPRRAVR